MLNKKKERTQPPTYAIGGARSSVKSPHSLHGASPRAGNSIASTNPNGGSSIPMAAGRSSVATKWQIAHCDGSGFESFVGVFPSRWQHDLTSAPPPSRIIPRGCSGTTTPNQRAITVSRKIRNPRLRTTSDDTVRPAYRQPHISATFRQRLSCPI